MRLSWMAVVGLVACGGVAPEARDASLTVDEDAGPVSGTLRLREAVDGASWDVVSGPAHGTFTLDEGRFTYTPDADYHGPDAVTFSVEANDASDTGELSITVVPVNDPPVVAPAAASCAEDTVADGVLAATDVDGDALAWSVVAEPTDGALALTAAGAWTYTPAADFAGADAFTVSVTDGVVDVETTVDLTVTPVDDPPVAQDGTLILTEDDGPTAGTFVATDVDGDALTFAVSVPPSHGVLVPGVAGAFTYTPDADFSGEDAATFEVTAAGVTDAATLAITVIPVNDAPEAPGASRTCVEDGTADGVVAATDADDDLLAFSVETAPAHGTLDLDVDSGAWIYAPDADYAGPDRFDIAVTDGVEAVVSVVDMTVTPVNDAPVALDDAVTVPEDGVVRWRVQASDVDGDDLTFAVSTPAGHGTVTVLDAATGELRYRPTADYAGPDTFGFSVSDGTATVTATVTVTVTPENDLPTVAEAELLVDEDASVSHTLVGFDADGDAFTFEIVIGPSKGMASLDGALLTYVADADLYGADAVVVRARDAVGAGPQTTISVSVFPVPDAPVVDAMAFEVAEDDALTDQLVASDADGDDVTFQQVTGPAHGAFTLQDDGTFDYVPDADYHGPDAFTVVATDGALSSDEVTIGLTVTPVNDAPVARDDEAETRFEQAVTLDLLANDDDIDGDALTVVAIGDPAHGSLSSENDGVYTYEPDGGFSGQDTFSYTVEDPSGAADTAVVTVTVHPAVTSRFEWTITSGSNAVCPALVSQGPTGGTLVGRITEDGRAEFLSRRLVTYSGSFADASGHTVWLTNGKGTYDFATGTLSGLTFDVAVETASGTLFGITTGVSFTASTTPAVAVPVGGTPVSASFTTTSSNCTTTTGAGWALPGTYRGKGSFNASFSRSFDMDPVAYETAAFGGARAGVGGLSLNEIQWMGTRFLVPGAGWDVSEVTVALRCFGSSAAPNTFFAAIVPLPGGLSTMPPGQDLSAAVWTTTAAGPPNRYDRVVLPVEPAVALAPGAYALVVGGSAALGTTAGCLAQEVETDSVPANYIMYGGSPARWNTTDLDRTHFQIRAAAH